MVLNVALIGGAAVLVLTHVRNNDAPAAAAGQPSGITSTVPTPDDAAVEPSSPATSSPSPDTQPVAGTTHAPLVKPTMRANFARGDAWPYAAGFREAGSPAWPLGVADGRMTHGPPQAANSVSWLERWMERDVRTIGARVAFATKHPGAAVLTAWQSSVLELSGQQQPATGMRLIALPGRWRLVAIETDGKSMLADGSYTERTPSATFNLVRRGATVWVTDPDGTVTSVTDPRIDSLAGPWASWELRESGPGKQPASFQEIWAG
jgi:hypothetical protein